MGTRLQLQELLELTINSTNVYFQPPASVKLNYPCVVYSRLKEDTTFANDRPYNKSTGYKVTVIDRNPDSPLLAKIADLPMCGFDRHYTADNLNHDVYTIYY